MTAEDRRRFGEVLGWPKLAANMQASMPAGTRPDRECVIVCGGWAGPAEPGARDATGEYLESFDPEARDGYGLIWWTADPAKAKVFPSFEAAFDEWRRVPVCRPVRHDAHPNRPLTAYTVVFESPPVPAAYRPEAQP